MRVIGGTAGGRVLSAPKGSRIRPTSDRVKEALFSILTSRFGSIQGLSVLDVFAGTGNVGIEALSRGAEKVFFIDNHPESLQLIRKNLIATGFEKKAELLRQDAIKGIDQLIALKESFDIVFIDPPYREEELTGNVLQAISKSGLTTPGGVIAVETGSKTTLPCPDQLSLLENRRYGDTSIWLFAKDDETYCFGG